MRRSAVANAMLIAFVAIYTFSQTVLAEQDDVEMNTATINQLPFLLTLQLTACKNSAGFADACGHPPFCISPSMHVNDMDYEACYQQVQEYGHTAAMRNECGVDFAKLQSTHYMCKDLVIGWRLDVAHLIDDDTDDDGGGSGGDGTGG